MTFENHLDTKITLYTDLKSTSGLNYTNVKPLDMKDYPKQLWCLGKLVAMSQQTEPFIHIDMDMFLWKKVPIEQFMHPFLVFHHENWIYKNMKIASKITPPPTLNRFWKYNKSNSNNFGLVGGTEWRAIVDAICEILEHIKINKEEIVQAIKQVEGDNVIWSAVLVEQIWITEILRKKKIKPKSFLGDKNSLLSLLPSFTYAENLKNLAKKIGISHYWAESKQTHYNDLIDAYRKWSRYFNYKTQ